MTARIGLALEITEVTLDLGALGVQGGPVLVGTEPTWWGPAAEGADSRFFPAEGEFLAPDEVVVTFDRGVPVAVDGETVLVAEARRMLSARGEAQGIGRGGALALVTAYRALDRATRDAGPARLVRQTGRGWPTLVRAVSGEVRLVLHDGRVTVARLRPTNHHNEEKREQ
jgi:hypothetical protein